jgi:Fe(3+) dicitrate transport protein
MATALYGQSDTTRQLGNVTVTATGTQMSGGKLRAVEGMAIYEGKKTEVVRLEQTNANLATNNARQVFARIAGLNIWESDGAGLQLGIGGRGLSPNRTSNFNTRQNGYDMSADALGYPESYYTPPTEALSRIEVVRGAASLQYGTQFGGMLNFVMKQPGGERPVAYTGRHTIGAWGFRNTFNSLQGNVQGDRLGYYAFFQRKQGNGWQPNAGFELNNAYADVHFKPIPRLMIDLEFTHMNYEAQQSGGLTDVQFEQNPRQSLRARNWFRVRWNLALIGLEYEINSRTRISSRTFGLSAARQALANLAPANVLDLGQKRDLISGTFNNIGNETRLLHRYGTGDRPNTLVLGTRVYRGVSSARQGEANDGSGPDFFFLNPGNVEQSDYVFPNYNYAAFAENIFWLSPRWTLTPGIRVERIQTFAEGYYKQRVFDLAGNLISEQKTDENLSRTRAFVLGGLGLSFKQNEHLEWYANVSQNYRAINFTDLRIQNPNGRVDPNIRDERGYTADLGVRTKRSDWLYADITAFYLAYRDRIGLLLRADQPPLYNDYRLRTNIADARNVGVEAFSEVNFWRFVAPADSVTRFTAFVNLSFIDARYIRTDDASIRNRKVEFVAPVTFRTGLSFTRKGWRAGFNWAYTAEHFTDATNTRRSASGVNGLIPAYTVADLSLAYHWKHWGVEGSCNNLFDQAYFTRRAEGYPGPGIIPADGRSWYVTLVMKW